MAGSLTDALLDSILSDAQQTESEIPNDNALGLVSKLARRQLEFEQDIAAKEKEIEDLTKQWNDIRLKQLPKAMNDAQLSSFKLQDGSEVEVEEKHYASITDDNRNAALQWFRDNGHGGLIKNLLEIQFGKGTEELQKKVSDFLKELKIQFTCKEGIHANTLKSFVTEQMKAKIDLPKDTLGIYSQETAKIKPPKVVKRKKESEA